MNLAERIAPHLPYLRRLARATTGNQVIGDAFVADLLQSLVADPAKFNMEVPGKLETFHLLCEALGREGVAARPKRGAAKWEIEAVKRLEPIPLAHRLAFLLRSVEGFTPAEISYILGTPVEQVEHDIENFADELASQLATDVLIIEDEPLIAMDIEDLVKGLGHRVSSIARTHAEAVEAVARLRPGLILADIQLADGSSGIEAVNEILTSFDLPVIFITAYPERLLTGLRPEPAFLIAKPFQPDMVRAVVSQALFFNEGARPPGRTAAGTERRPLGA